MSAKSDKIAVITEIIKDSVDETTIKAIKEVLFGEEQNKTHLIKYATDQSYRDEVNKLNQPKQLFKKDVLVNGVQYTSLDGTYTLCFDNNKNLTFLSDKKQKLTVSYTEATKEFMITREYKENLAYTTKYTNAELVYFSQQLSKDNTKPSAVWEYKKPTTEEEKAKTSIHLYHLNDDGSLGKEVDNAQETIDLMFNKETYQPNILTNILSNPVLDNTIDNFVTSHDGLIAFNKLIRVEDF